MAKQQTQILRDPERARKIRRNFFLHIHSPKIDIHALKPSYTLGLGVILVSLFVILLCTGAFLMLHYTPSVDSAYMSVKEIVFIVPGGRYIRNIHRWAAHGIVFVTFLHMIRVFYTASYGRGRGFNWVIGVVLLLMVLLMNFSGYLLPWDQLAYWAVTIGSNIASSAHELTDMLGITGYFDPGGFIKRIFLGGNQVTQATLTRFFMLHVILLPMTFLVLTGLHLWRIRKDGGLSKPGIKEGGKPAMRIYSWPTLLWAELAVFMFTLTILFVMAILVDAPLKEQANPVLPENPAKSPWYFLGIQEMVSSAAFMGGVVIPLLFVGFLISIPYYDKEEACLGQWFSGKKGLRITLRSFIVAFILTSLCILFFAEAASFGISIRRLPGPLLFILNPATLSMIIYILWAQIVKRGTNSVRMAAIALFTTVMTGFILFTVTGIWLRGKDWAFVW